MSRKKRFRQKIFFAEIRCASKKFCYNEGMKNNMTDKIKALWKASNNPLRYVIGCATYYKGRGYNLRQIVDAEYDAMMNIRKELPPPPAEIVIP